MLIYCSDIPITVLVISILDTIINSTPMHGTCIHVHTTEYTVHMYKHILLHIQYTNSSITCSGVSSSLMPSVPHTLTSMSSVVVSSRRCLGEPRHVGVRSTAGSLCTNTLLSILQGVIGEEMVKSYISSIGSLTVVVSTYKSLSYTRTTETSITRAGRTTVTQSKTISICPNVLAARPSICY